MIGYNLLSHPGQVPCQSPEQKKKMYLKKFNRKKSYEGLTQGNISY